MKLFDTKMLHKMAKEKKTQEKKQKAADTIKTLQ